MASIVSTALAVALAAAGVNWSQRLPQSAAQPAEESGQGRSLAANVSREPGVQTATLKGLKLPHEAGTNSDTAMPRHQLQESIVSVYL